MIKPATHPDLVYDIGAHNGDDTASYLGWGYRVVAVEASPSLYRKLLQRFSREIQDGRVIVVNAAVTDTDSEKVTFYVSQDDWRSSLIKHISSRESVTLDAVEVCARTLVSLFSEYGVPGYCKIDIEGYDALVIAAMSCQSSHPLYLSCEVSCENISAIDQQEELLYLALDAMQTAGYSAFKLIDQQHVVVLAEAAHYSHLHSFPGRIKAKREQLLRMLTRRVPPTTTPFGEGLPGEWKDYATTKKYLLYHFKDYFRHTRNKELMFWVDLHAK